MNAWAILSDDAEQAARLCTRAVLEGDDDRARMWALEYAAHRDCKLSSDERGARVETAGRLR